MRSPTLALTIVGFTLIGLACSDSSGPGDGPSIRAELIRLPGSAAPAAQAVGIAASVTEANAISWSSEMEIASFESPIRAIWLEGDGGAMSMVYECDADSNDDCLVDLAGPALQDLLAAEPVTAVAGTYTEVSVSTCEDEGQYQAYVTASVTVGGQAYVTNSQDVLVAGGTAEPVSVVFSGCQRRYPIPNPLVIEDTAGATIEFKLYFDIREIAWASLGDPETMTGWIPGGCAGPSPGGQTSSPYLCAAYPDVAGVVDNVTPVIERYRINDGATIGLIFQGGSGDFIGGFTRRYFAEGVPASPGFTADTPVEEWTDNGDGSYRLTTYGTSSEGGSPVGHYLTIESFVRDTHAGTALDFGGNSFPYQAVRIE